MSSDTRPLVDFQSVGRTFGDIEALAPCDLSVQRGEFVSIIGPSGCGKSTLLRLASKLDTPTSGTIDFSTDSVGYVFQDARLFPHLDVKQNLDYGRCMNRLSFDPAAQDRVVALLDIGHLLDRRTGQLSGGERQRVALGRALLARPRLLLFDEPLGALDADRKAEILPYLVRLRDETGVPMIYVSHDADELRRLATDVVVLERGRVARAGSPDLLVERPPASPEL